MSGNTPKPMPVPDGNVVPFPLSAPKKTALEKPPRREREGTMEYDRRSGEVHVPGSARQRDATPTDLMLRTPDGLAPGEATEIVVELTDLAVAKPKDPLDVLPTQTFDKQVVIRNESEPRGYKYYEILTGYAHLRTLDDHGKLTATPRDLGPGDFIGLLGFSRVASRTDLRVRVYDLSQISESRNTSLQLQAQSKILQAAAELAARLNQESAKLLAAIAERDALLRGRLDELKDQVVRPLHEKNRAQGEEILGLNEQLGALTAALAELEDWKRDALVWMPEQIGKKDEEIARLQAEIERMKIDRQADSQSLTLLLDEFDDLVDEGVLDASEKGIAELVSVVEGHLTLCLTSEDVNAIRNSSMRAQGGLHAFKMKVRTKKAPK